MGTHLDSTLSLNGNFNSKYKKFSSRLCLLSKMCPNLNVKAARRIYANIVIPFFTYCETVNLNLLRESLGKPDRIHERAVGIITKTNTVKLTPIRTYLKRHACQIVSTSITRQLPVPMSNFFELLSHSNSTRNKLSIVLSRVRTKGAKIYNSLAKDICVQENKSLFLKWSCNS